MSIHIRLKAARVKRGLTQEQVGATFSSNEKPEGFGKGTVSAWEKGINVVTAAQLVSLCLLYDVSADYLLFGKESVLSEKESWLLDAYRSNGETGRTVIDGAVNVVLNLRGAANDKASISAIATK